MEIEERLESLFEKYIEEIESVAMAAFEKEVLPVLKKRNMILLSGMGSFWLAYKKPHRIVHDRDEIPENDTDLLSVWDLLSVSIPGKEANCFAEFMPDFNPDQSEA